jgi:UDP-glucuronate decarboxylase
MRILITGGAGFIGSHLCDRLLAEGHSVMALDNLITGSTGNIQHLAGRDDFLFVKHNVSNYIYVDGTLDAVLHFASPASPSQTAATSYLQLPIQTLKAGALGTHNALGVAKAKGARFLLASTSEIYGDPLEHPQKESYWGHVDPVGPRSVYDEAKRFAEAITMAYHRAHGVDTRIVRIFNSILADERVLLFNSDEAHLTQIEEYADSIERDGLIRPRRIRVPAFDPRTGCISLQEASALIKHPPVRKDAFLIRTRYGREIKVTGDHSIFRRNRSGAPEAIPVRELAVGDYVAIAGRLPVVERDRPSINLAEHLLERATSDDDLWGVAIMASELGALIEENRHAIQDILLESRRFDSSRRKRNSTGCAYRKYLRGCYLPLYVIARLRQRLALPIPSCARIRLFLAGAVNTLPNQFAISDELLWVLGLFLAEGTLAEYPDRGTYFVTISSDQAWLDWARRILADLLGLKVGSIRHSVNRAPSIYIHSKLLCLVLGDILGLRGHSAKKRIPAWVFQLPLSRFKHFMEGYRAGDGTHSGQKLGNELTFVTVSKDLAQDLTLALLRFGIVASLGGPYETNIEKRYPGRRYCFYSVNVAALSDFNILNWDRGVIQTLNATRFGDLVWVPIKTIETVQTTDYVYDFAVPGHENFVAGTGIFAHNTYGPRMQLDDGRVVPNFVGQALRHEPLTVYGDGAQTRSFCFVSDLVDGILRLLASDEHLPVNIGNPAEITILEFAQMINGLTDNPAGIQMVPSGRTGGDPERRRPDISKAQQVLGWQPAIGLEDGLRQTIEYFRKTMD